MVMSLHQQASEGTESTRNTSTSEIILHQAEEVLEAKAE